MYEAYLPLPGSCLLCLLTTGLLSESKLELVSHYHLPNPVLQLHQAWCWDRCHFRRCLWTVRVLGADTTAHEQTFPVLARIMSCILGTQRLGYLLFH